MIRIGVLGAGHLGKIHIKLIKEIPQFDLIGFYDPDDENANKVIAEFGINRYDSVDSLLEEVDAVDIVTPTITHYKCAAKALKKAMSVLKVRYLNTLNAEM